MRTPLSRNRQFATAHSALLATVALIGLAMLAQPAMASNVAKLGRECREGKQKACDELAKIALTDKRADQRREAADVVTDQTVLERMALEDPEKFVRVAAVKHLTGELALVKVALADQDNEVSQVALLKLKKPVSVFQVALQAKSESTRSLATAMLKDIPVPFQVYQGLLARLVVESTDARIRSKAMESITDQQSVETVATASKDAAIQAAAVWKLKDPGVLRLLATNATEETVRKAALAALDVTTTQAEREVYVWKAPADYGTDASRPHWKISARVGRASIAGGFVTNQSAAGAMAENLMSGEINSEAKGFSAWWFAPESDKDSLVLESGKLTVATMLVVGRNSTTVGQDIPAPATFHTRVADGKGSWLITNGILALILQPKLHINPSGTLAMTGVWVGYGSVPNAVSFTSAPIGDIDVSVVGTIRFPADQWTLAGAGIEIMGGGLQFDETGVFLLPGTKYRKHVQ